MSLFKYQLRNPICKLQHNFLSTCVQLKDHGKYYANENENDHYGNEIDSALLQVISLCLIMF